MTWEAETIIDVPFHDVDQMGIVWHGHYAKYFEIARCLLLDQIEYNYEQMKKSGYAWPVIDLHVRFPKPTRFGQKVRVKAKLIEWEHRLKIAYLIEDADTGERLTKGHTIQVAVDMKNQEMCLASPPILAEHLGVA